VQAAKAGGFDVFGFAHGKNKNTFVELGAALFYSMPELETLLEVDK
jgi:beta-phosphoglucomutase-like phosphatase (HAD superfamily)